MIELLCFTAKDVSLLMLLIVLLNSDYEVLICFEYCEM